MATTSAPQLARRLNEIGKIRIGCQVPIEQGKNAGKPRPERLKYFRLTSNSHAALSVAAQKYHGTVQEWTIRPEWQSLPQMRQPDHKFELFTASDTLDVIIRADGLMDTQWEQWDGAYCTRRCTGEFITFDGYGKLEGLECQCPMNVETRKALAAKGQACMAVSRLCVMLEGLPLGQWRLDTRGENTPAEIRGLQEILAGCGVGTAMLRATMRLEFRTSRQMTAGKKEVHHYSCVVIEPRYTPEALLQEGERYQAKLLAMPVESVKSVEDHIADLYGHDPRGSTMQVPVTRDDAPGTSDVPNEASTPSASILGDAGANERHTPLPSLRSQITDVLYAQGLDNEAVAAWWVRQQAKYPDLSPGWLTAMLERLQTKAQATPRGASEPAEEPI